MVRTLASFAVALTLLASTASADDFKKTQLAAKRVKAAHAAKLPVVKALFEEKGLPFPPAGVLLRVFKEERALELWGRKKGSDEYLLVKEYPICESSGVLGPKRQEGDLQVPEGFYSINHFNPVSNFHLSLGVSYPNESDRILGKKGRLGGAIYIHGSCVTIGCVPITDELIEEVYVAGLEAKAAGQASIPVHMFPARLTDENYARLSREHPDDPSLVQFWGDLKAGFDAFETTRKLPKIRVDARGRYLVKAR